MFRILPSGRSWMRISLLLALLTCAGCDKPQVVGVGAAAPGISGNDIHGEYLSLNQLKGKVVIVYFWANTCCGGNLKQLEPFYRQHKYDGLEILAINGQDSEKEVLSFAKNNALTFTVMTDEHSILMKQYKAFGFPTVFILDRNGTVREKILGAIQTDKLEKLATMYLDQKPAYK